MDRDSQPTHAAALWWLTFISHSVNYVPVSSVFLFSRQFFTNVQPTALITTVANGSVAWPKSNFLFYLQHGSIGILVQIVLNVIQTIYLSPPAQT